MFTLSAFADEISPDPQEQVNVLLASGVRYIEFRSILKTNVLALTDQHDPLHHSDVVRRDGHVVVVEAPAAAQVERVPVGR